MATKNPRKKRRAFWIVLIVILLGLIGLGGWYSLRRLRSRHLVLTNRGMMYLEQGEYVRAMESFRAALKHDPEYQPARVGVVRALTERKAFAEALAELDEAVKKGLSRTEGSVIRARVYYLRARHRLASAGASISAEDCRDVINADIRPGVRLLKEYAGRLEKPADGYCALGDMLSLQADALKMTRRALLREQTEARNMGRQESAAQKGSAARAVVKDIQKAQQAAMGAYSDAIKHDPATAKPRVRIAEAELRSYLPRSDRVKAVLEPLLKQPEPSPDARVLLAVAETFAGDYDEALAHVRPLREQQPENPQFLKREVMILVEAKRWKAADPLSEELCKLMPKNPHVAYLRGVVLLRLGRLADAGTYLQNVFESSQIRWPQARYALAEVLRKQGNREQAVSTFKAVLEDIAATRSANIHETQERREIAYQCCLFLAGALKESLPELAFDYAKRGAALFPERAKAIEAARDVLVKAPKRRKELEDIILRHAMTLAAKGDAEAGLDVCRRELQHADEWRDRGARLRLHMARIFKRRGEYTQAMKAYETLWKAFPKMTSYGHELAALEKRLARDDEARETYAEILRSNPVDTQAISGLVEIMVRKGKDKEAEALLIRAGRRLGWKAVQRTLTELFLKEGRSDQAISLARAQLSANGKSPYAYVLLADLLWRKGNLKEAEALFAAALRLEPNFPQAYNLGLLYLQQGKNSAAIGLMREASNRFSKGRTFVVALALALQAEGRVKEAVEALDRILVGQEKRDPGLDTPRWLSAVMQAALGDSKAADARNKMMLTANIGLLEDRQSLLRSVAALAQPGRRQVSVALNQMAVFNRSGFLPVAARQLQIVKRLIPEHPLPECWYLRSLDAEGKHSEAVERYQKIISVHPEFAFAAIQLAESHTRHSETEPAVRVLKRALPYLSQKGAAWVYVRLGELHEQECRVDDAIAVYRNAIQSREFGVQACNQIAMLLAIQRNDPQAALPFATEAVERGGPQPALLDTLGWVYYLLDDTQKAVKCLRRARTTAPNEPTIRFHLGMLLLKLGQKAEAKAELTEALNLSRTFPEAQEARDALDSL